MHVSPRAGYLAATNEWLILYIDIDKRRTGRMPPALERGFQAILTAHAPLPLPPEVGRKIDFTRGGPRS